MKPVSFQLLTLRSLQRRERCLSLPCDHVYSAKATVQDWQVGQNAAPSVGHTENTKARIQDLHKVALLFSSSQRRLPSVAGTPYLLGLLSLEALRCL